MEIKTTVVFSHLEQSCKRITVEQGGTRSGKTYNILLWIILSYCARNIGKGKIISVVRKTFPSLRGTAMRDFDEILQAAGLYYAGMHNKGNSEYVVFGNRVEFISLDQPQKMRGRKRDLLFINEANELTWEEFFQLNIRTAEKVILDYNPSMEYHWIYSEVIPRDDCEFFKTTYIDNPFLTEMQIKEIVRLRAVGGYHWTVYGLGEKGHNPNVVFTFTEVKDFPRMEDGELAVTLVGTGLDWGFTNDPTACVQIYRRGDDLYLKQLIYQRGMTNIDISNKLKSISFPLDEVIYYDPAEPKSGEDLRRMGWRAIASVSRTKHNKYGIDLAKRYNLFLLSKDVDLIKEFNNYIFKTDASGKPSNEIVDLFDHGVDAFMYGLLMTLGRGFGKYAVE